MSCGRSYCDMHKHYTKSALYIESTHLSKAQQSTLAKCMELCIKDKEQRCRSISWRVGDCNLYPGDCPHTQGNAAQKRKYKTYTRKDYAARTMPRGLMFSKKRTDAAMYSNKKVAIGAANTFIAIVTPSSGKALNYGTVVGFRPADALGVFAWVR